jgi:hypothetical protein
MYQSMIWDEVTNQYVMEREPEPKLDQVETAPPMEGLDEAANITESRIRSFIDKFQVSQTSQVSQVKPEGGPMSRTSDELKPT